MRSPTPPRERASLAAVIGLALLALGLLLGLPARAGAATEVRSTPPDYSPRGYQGAIEVTADRSENRITLAFDSDGPAFVIRDSERIVSGDCERLSRTAVRCSVESVDYELYVAANGGKDRVKIRDSVAAPAILVGEHGADELIGGRGDDWIAGGEGRDDLHGRAGRDILGDGRGRDVMRGGGGDDYVGSGPGRDVLLGGDGNDFLEAGAEASPDRRIDCGRGWNDIASVFYRQPKPRRCEQIRLER